MFWLALDARGVVRAGCPQILAAIRPTPSSSPGLPILTLDVDGTPTRVIIPSLIFCEILTEPALTGNGHGGMTAMDRPGRVGVDVAGRIGGEAPRGDASTLGGLIDAYAASPRFAARSEGHRAQSLRYIEACIAFNGWTTVDDLAAVGLEAFAKSYADRAQYEAANHAIARVKAWSTWLTNRRLIEHNPFEHVEMIPHRKPPTTRCPTVEEVRTLVLIGNQMAERGDVYLMAALSGLRGAEIARLRWHHIQLDDPPHVALTPDITKSGKAEWVPLCDELRDMLRRRWQVADVRRTDGGRATDARVFGPVPQPKVFNRDLDRGGIAKKTAQGKLTLHQMRKFFITQLAVAGVSPTVAKSLARHADMRTTIQTYTDARMLDLRGSVQKLPRIGLDGGDSFRDTHDAVTMGASMMTTVENTTSLPAAEPSHPTGTATASGSDAPFSGPRDCIDDARAPKARALPTELRPDGGPDSRQSTSGDAGSTPAGSYAARRLEAKDPGIAGAAAWMDTLRNHDTRDAACGHGTSPEVSPGPRRGEQVSNPARALSPSDILNSLHPKKLAELLAWLREEESQ